MLFEREPRFAGEVKCNFGKSLALALNALISFSKVPLRISTYIGLLAAVAAIMMALLVLNWRILVSHSPLTNFTIILVGIFFLGAVQLVSISILGEYIGQIHEQVKGRLYTLAEIGGFSSLVKTSQ